jgi:D-alanyl-lipoteichoic acid acyltransferase DltB (MBOAT superfamily)
MDFLVGLRIGDAGTERTRKRWLLVSLVTNLGVLCWFKYFNFFITSAAGFLGWVGLPVSDWTLRIFLPFGISFYTFQSMSYSIEVYRGASNRSAPFSIWLSLSRFSRSWLRDRSFAR